MEGVSKGGKMLQDIICDIHLAHDTEQRLGVTIDTELIHSSYVIEFNAT